MKEKVCKAVVSLMLFGLLIQLGGCKTEQQENPSNEVVPEQTENTDIEITKEYLCSEFGIDESEFEGVDFEDFVNEFHLTYESVQGENIKALLQIYKFYQEEYENIKTYDYREIFMYKSEVLLTEDKQEDIAVLVFLHCSDGQRQFSIFDFEMGKMMSLSAFYSTFFASSTGQDHFHRE